MRHNVTDYQEQASLSSNGTNEVLILRLVRLKIEENSSETRKKN